MKDLMQNKFNSFTALYYILKKKAERKDNLKEIGTTPETK